MRASISEVSVTTKTRPCLMKVRFQVTNLGPKPWSINEGFTAAVQIREAETDTVIIDGPQSKLSKTVTPGESTNFEISIELPSITGQFHIFISMFQEGKGWFFEHGSPFLLIEYDITDGNTTVARQAVTTLSTHKNRLLLRTVKRAFTYPVLVFLRHGSLIRSMVRRDLLGRYRGSYAGLFWTVMHPLMMILTYCFVFGIVLKTRFGEHGQPSDFVLYFIAGMLPWLAFSEAVGRAPSTVVEHSNFVRKLVFPVEILPVTLVITGLLSEILGAGIFVLGMTAFGHMPSAALLYLPFILIPQLLLTFGLCWGLAALGVFFRDMSQIIGFCLTIWFFTTPICYPETALPSDYAYFFELNPLYILVRSYRAIFLESSPPPWIPLGWLTVGATLIFLIGHGWFYKLKRSFSGVI